MARDSCSTSKPSASISRDGMCTATEDRAFPPESNLWMCRWVPHHSWAMEPATKRWCTDASRKGHMIDLYQYLRLPLDQPLHSLRFHVSPWSALGGHVFFTLNPSLFHGCCACYAIFFAQISLTVGNFKRVEPSDKVNWLLPDAADGPLAESHGLGVIIQVRVLVRAHA